MATYAVVPEESGSIRIDKTVGLTCRCIGLQRQRAQILHLDFLNEIWSARAKAKPISFTFTSGRMDDSALTFDGNLAEAEAFEREFKAALAAKGVA